MQQHLLLQVENSPNMRWIWKIEKNSPVPVLIIFSTPGFWIFSVPWSHPELPQATGANHHLSQPRKGWSCFFLTPPTRQLNSPPWRFLASWWNSSPVSSQMTSLSSASWDVDVYLHQPEILSNFFRPLSGSPLIVHLDTMWCPVFLEGESYCWCFRNLAFFPPRCFWNLRFHHEINYWWKRSG